MCLKGAPFNFSDATSFDCVNASLMVETCTSFEIPFSPAIYTVNVRQKKGVSFKIHFAHVIHRIAINVKNKSEMNAVCSPANRVKYFVKN